MKRCSICKVEKSLDDFHRHSISKDGKESYCKPCRNAKNRQWSKDNVEAHYRKAIRRHGITVERYDEMLVEQNGKCAVCERPPDKKRLGIDHDHACCPGSWSCGKCIRGLLCDRCNSATGMLGDSLEVVSNLLDYLKKFSEDA